MTIIDTVPTTDWHSDHHQVYLPDGSVCIAAKVYRPSEVNPYRIDGPLLALAHTDKRVTFFDEYGVTVFSAPTEGRMFVIAHADTKERAEALLAQAETGYLVEHGFRLRTLEVQHSTAFQIALRSGWSPS